MELAACLDQLSIQEGKSAIEPGWEASQTSLLSTIPFLSEPTIKAAASYVGLDSGIIPQLCQASAMIAERPALRALWWHGRQTFLGETEAVLAKWPMLTATLGDRDGLFPVLILLSTWEKTCAIHKAHRIPSQIIKDTMSDLQLNMERYKDRTGHWGVGFELAGGWLGRHFKGKIYRLGRLQFLLTRFPAICRVFRNAAGATVALAEDGLVLRQDGYLDGAAGVHDQSGAWTTTCREAASGYRGYPIDPALGAVVNEEVTLPYQSWEVALQPGDPVYDIHIPESGPMTMDLCRESVAQVFPFYAKHFPEEEAGKGLICNSWLLDCQLEKILKPSSNIFLFLKQFYLTPTSSDPWSILRSIFGLDIPWNSDGAFDFSVLPHGSSLQRGILAHLEAGRRWRKSGGFVLAEDLPWGRTDYRRKSRTRQEYKNNAFCC